MPLPVDIPPSGRSNPYLIAGPYHPPACTIGGWLDDEIDGLIEVGGWTSAPIPWPRRKKTGRASLILTSELARAVRIESAEAICHFWGVGQTKVWQWRQALSVGRVTAGTRALLQERTGVPAAAAALGRRRARRPESREKMAMSKRGRPAHPNTRLALEKAAKRRKSAAWGVKASAWMRGEDLPKMQKGEWTAKDLMRLRDEYQRGRPASALAVLLGRTLASIEGQIQTMGLPTVSRKKWKTKK